MIMLQRVISITVTSSDGKVLFEKEIANPQDVMASLALFEGDGVSVLVTMHDVSVASNSRKK